MQNGKAAVAGPHDVQLVLHSLEENISVTRLLSTASCLKKIQVAGKDI